MINLKEEIAKLISEQVADLSLDEVKNMIETPQDSKMGDYAFPCFKLAKILRKAPPLIAKGIAEAIAENDIFEKVEQVNAYVNMFISKEEFVEEISEPAFEETAEPEEEAEQLTIAPEEEAEPEEEPTDPMAAVEAFSRETFTPTENPMGFTEISEEAEMEDKSLFEENNEQPFESYFNVSKKDAHLDKTQTISLVPPEDYDSEDDGEDRHKHFFKKNLL